MAEKRTLERTRKRVMIRFGAGKLERTAFSKNISETGVFLQTNNVFPPGTTLQLEMKFPDQTFGMWAKVVWAKKVPPQLAHVLECGMGLCFVNPPADWPDYYRRWRE